MSIREKRFAFTLAEALITLVILGVIAALTVPGLKRFSQKETTVIQLKKAYTTMNGVLDYVIADNITMDIEKVGGDEFFTKYMIPRLNGVKQCAGNNMSECFAPSVEGLDLTPTNAVAVPDGSVIANNGFDYIIDINGPAEPNVVGADVFRYKLQKVKGDNQAAMLMDYDSLVASLFNSLTPAAFAYNDLDQAIDLPCPPCGWCGGTERFCGFIPNDDPKDIVVPKEPDCIKAGTCLIVGPEEIEPLPPDPIDPCAKPGACVPPPPGPSSSSGSTSSSSSGGDSGSDIVVPDTGSSGSSSSSSGGGIVTPDTGSSSSSGSSSGSSSDGGSGSSSSSSGAGDTDVTFDSATNTAGWRFVPIGKTADIMNNNWKIKVW